MEEIWSVIAGHLKPDLEESFLQCHASLLSSAVAEPELHKLNSARWSSEHFRETAPWSHPIHTTTHLGGILLAPDKSSTAPASALPAH